MFVAVALCISGCILTIFSLIYIIKLAKIRQDLAFKGDTTAAKRIILPCYRPIFRCLIAVYFIFAILLGLTFIGSINDDKFPTRFTVQYFCFSILTIYCIAPVLLLQSSVSMFGFWNTFFTIIPWWAICNILWFVSLLKGPTATIFKIYFLACASLIPCGLSFSVLTKALSSRVQVGSCSNRNSAEFLLVYSITFGIAYLTEILLNSDSGRWGVEVFMVVFSFVANQFFPFALYRTLLADTKFWRGLGVHNAGGIDVNDTLRDSGIDIHRPTMELNTVSSSFQTMMTDIKDISIDFAYLQLERVIGQGASSKVFSGKYKEKLVAIKLSTPPEVTQEVIDVFVAEAKIAAALSHPNIVRFIGICVRPPQIAMVFEFCEGGNLKTNLQKHFDRWTPSAKLKACLDAAKAVECLHLMGFIHRDLKAENFFVGHKNIVKLGDFGESTRVRNKESTILKRMSILGTVSFMAPELITASKHYGQSVDIYALSVTMWEIWTGLDPYDSKSHFEIYDAVGKGLRPDMPNNSPNGFNDLLANAWQQDATLRLSAGDIVVKIEQILFGVVKKSELINSQISLANGVVDHITD